MSGQAQLFVTSQREALVSVLRNIALSSAVVVQEVQLIILIMRIALPAVTEDDMVRRWPRLVRADG